VRCTISHADCSLNPCPLGQISETLAALFKVVPMNALVRPNPRTCSPLRSLFVRAGSARSSIGLTLLVYTTFVSVAACKKPPAAEPAAVSAVPVASVPPAVAPQANAPAAAPQAEVSWKAPERWTSVPPTSSMRKATFKVPAAKGDSEGGEVAVFYFGAGQGGSVEANVQRWIGQFSGVEASSIQRSDQTAGAFKAHLVEIPSGTYTDSMAAMHGGAVSPKEKYALLGAIVETPVGPYFFKFTGPKATVAAAKSDFASLLSSIK
jgi:hypothetical protein